MRKLRRLPWRIPKQHHAQPNAGAAPVEACPRVDIEREIRREREREERNAQPVAFTAGRYVAPKVARPAEIRRKAHRLIVMPLPAAT